MFEESASAIPSSSLWASMNSWFTPTVLFVLLNVVIGTIALTSSLQKQHHNQNQQQTQQQQQQTQQQHENDSHQPNKLIRSPSVLQRLKSINFYAHYRSQEPQISSHNKQSPDSDTLFNLDQTHQAQTPDLQPQSHYFFEQNHQENVGISETQTHYIFEQTHEQNPEITQTHFDFAEKIEENDEMRSMDEVYSHFVRTKSDTAPASGVIPTKLPTKMKKSASSKSAFGHFEERDIVEARRPATVREKGNAKVTDEDDEEVDSKADDFINKFKQQLKLQRLDSIIRYKDMIGRGSGGK